MKKIIIAAVADNGVIGNAGGLAWSIPADKEFYEATVEGQWMLMGRKTYESGAVGSEIDSEKVVVISRNPAFRIQPGNTFVEIQQGFNHAREQGAACIYILGGGQIYKQTIGQADELLISEIHAVVDGDTHFPAIDLNDWEEVEREDHSADLHNQYAFSFVRYIRRSA